MGYSNIFLQECGEERYSIKRSDGFAEKGTSTDNPCNIYDMASNYWELTTETSSNFDLPCVYRGGYYNDRDLKTSTRQR